LRNKSILILEVKKKGEKIMLKLELKEIAEKLLKKGVDTDIVDSILYQHITDEEFEDISEETPISMPYAECDRHLNLLRYGFCIEGNRFNAEDQMMENVTLETVLFDLE
jgi:NH3-dependent NAD+ synthetase